MPRANHFRPERAPSPLPFFEKELGVRLPRENSKGYTLGPCQFHKSKSKRSFSVNTKTGAFHCFGCDVRGGDVFDYVKLRDGCDFKTAARTLGCWDEVVTDDERRRIEMQNAQRQKRREEEARLEQITHDERMRLTDEIHTLIQIQAETSIRLSELLSGAEPHYESEREHYWGILALICDDLRDCESAYMVLAGLGDAA